MPKKKKKSNAGRKIFDGKDEKMVLTKLEQAFSIGATDAQACFYADISEQALYRYEKENPKFRERKHLLKEKLVLQARQTLAKDIETNPENAKWYLVKKAPAEFGDRQEIVHKVVNLSVEAEKRLKKYEDK